jgi:hypothetical protein
VERWCGSSGGRSCDFFVVQLTDQPQIPMFSSELVQQHILQCSCRGSSACQLALASGLRRSASSRPSEPPPSQSSGSPSSQSFRRAMKSLNLQHEWSQARSETAIEACSSLQRRKLGQTCLTWELRRTRFAAFLQKGSLRVVMPCMVIGMGALCVAIFVGYVFWMARPENRDIHGPARLPHALTSRGRQ